MNIQQVLDQLVILHGRGIRAYTRRHTLTRSTALLIRYEPDRRFECETDVSDLVLEDSNEKLVVQTLDKTVRDGARLARGRAIEAVILDGDFQLPSGESDALVRGLLNALDHTPGMSDADADGLAERLVAIVLKWASSETRDRIGIKLLEHVERFDSSTFRPNPPIVEE